MRRILAVIIGITALAAVAVGVFFFLKKDESPKIPNLLPVLSGEKKVSEIFSAPNDIAPPISPESFLTGLPRENQNPEKIFAVMVEESVAARGNYRGIESAKLLFEIPAEGGIPRFAALFSSDDLPEEIGPVRSARDYFLEFIAPLSGAIVHAGGSPQAFEWLATSDIVDINHESETDPQFFRDEELSAPHNLFVKTAEITEEIPSLEDKVGFLFDENISGGSNVSQIQIDFSTSSHLVDYEFDPEKNCFQRSQKYESADLCFENVVVLETDMWLLEDEEGKGRLGMNTTGNGNATIFRNGRAILGQWERKTGEKIHLINADDEKIPLQPGKTIISFIDKPEKLRFEK